MSESRPKRSSTAGEGQGADGRSVWWGYSETSHSEREIGTHTQTLLPLNPLA